MKNLDRTVFVPNRGGHNYSAAEDFGKLVFLTEGNIRRFAVSTHYRVMIEKMRAAHREDFVLVSSLSILNSIATGILARRFGQVNFLLFHDGVYVQRSVNFDSLLAEDITEIEYDPSDGPSPTESGKGIAKRR